MGNLLGQNKEIPDGINAGVFRLSAENKNLLSEKNSMYVGTGETTFQGTEEIVQTGVISPPQNEEQALRYDGSSTNINWQQLSTGDLVQDKALSTTTFSAIATALGITDAQLQSIVSLLSILSVSGQIITFNSSLYADSYANLSSLFTYTTSNNEVTVTGLTEDGKNYLTQYNGEMIIPSSISGNTVTTIGSSAFSNITNLTSITIPNSVINVNKSAFSGCTGLTSVYYTGDVAGWCGISFGGSSANPLYYAGNLYIGGSLVKDLVIPDSVTSIGDYAFDGCSSLTSVTIPDSVTSIGYDTFRGCTGLVSVSMGDGIKSIGSWGFTNCSGLTSITIPDSVTSIGNSAFEGCSGLQTLVLGEGIATIGSAAFSGCTNLNLINWNAVNVADFTVEGTAFGTVGTTGNGVSLIFGENVERIPSYALQGATGIKNISIGNKVSTIGRDAFWGCSSVVSITMGSGVVDIGEEAFRDCTGLPSIIIGDGVTSIGGSAFDNCTNLTSVTIPSAVVNIGDSAFSGCTGLTSINWNAVSLNNLSSSNNIFFNIGAATSGVKVIFGDSVEAIPSYLFYIPTIGSRPNIKEVVMGANVKSIGGSAFDSCYNLTSITIPDSVTSIGGLAFSGCSGLTTIIIPDSVTSIGGSAFYGCSGLTSVTIGSGVTSIGNSAFQNCSALTSINWNAVSITDSPSTGGVFRGVGSATDGTTLTIGATCQSLSAWLFYSMTNGANIKTVILGSGLSSIGQGALSIKNLSSAIFVDTSGWQVSTSVSFSSYTDLSSSDLANTSTAATYLNSTYASYYWRKV